MSTQLQIETIQNKIFTIRGTQVMIDSDLAELYQVENKALKRAVRRNMERFPEDFMFTLTEQEARKLGIRDIPKANLGHPEVTDKVGNERYLPFAFREPGVAMLSTVLNSTRAIEVNIAIIRVFVSLRNREGAQSEFTKVLATLGIRLDSIEMLLNNEKIGKSHQLRRNGPGSALPRRSTYHPTVSQNVHILKIQQAIAQRWGIKVADLISNQRSRSMVAPRQVAIYLSRELTLLSHSEIGKHFGYRDHTTILYAYQKIKQSLSTDPELHKITQELRESLSFDPNTSPNKSLEPAYLDSLFKKILRNQ